MSRIPITFYHDEDVVKLSQLLIGKHLFTCMRPENVITGGMIIETEAYCGVEDKASHAYNNRRTKRTEILYSLGGVSYVYLCYGIHNMFNIVTNKEGIPHAILVRAIQPEVGIDVMLRRRNKEKPTSTLTSGPGSLCQALGINRDHNGFALDGSQIWLEDRGIKIPLRSIHSGLRIGVAYAEEDALKPWRFFL